jgi:hypothetical protein
MSGTEVTMLRRGDSLVPSCEMFREDLLAIPEGKEVFVTIRRARSPRHHRFFFAALQEIVRSGAWDGTVETLLIYLKIATGRVTTVIGDRGRTFYVPKSIAFESFSEDEFTGFKREVEKVLGERLHIDVEAIYQAVLSRSQLRDDVPTEVLTREKDAPSRSPSPASLEARLQALATELSKDTPDEVEAAWSEAWATDAVKDLFRLQPKCVEAIVKFARMKASGQLASGEAGYREMTGKAIAAAIERRKAA